MFSDYVLQNSLPYTNFTSIVSEYNKYKNYKILSYYIYLKVKKKNKTYESKFIFNYIFNRYNGFYFK